MQGGLGSGGMLPRKCFEKNCTIWCILGPILAFKVLLFLLFFFLFFFGGGGGIFFLMLPL